MSHDSSRDVIVIGGGITGLAAAYELTRRGCQPLVLEAAPRAGGLILTERADGFTIEAGGKGMSALVKVEDPDTFNEASLRFLRLQGPGAPL